jgi:hypothetical protein
MRRNRAKPFNFGRFLPRFVLTPRRMLLKVPAIRRGAFSRRLFLCAFLLSEATLTPTSKRKNTAKTTEQNNHND